MSAKALQKTLFSLPFHIIKGLLLLSVFIAAVCFNGTNDPLLAVFLPLLVFLSIVQIRDRLNGPLHLPKSSVLLWLAAFQLYLIFNLLWTSVPYNSTLFMMIFMTLPLSVLMIVMARDPEKSARTYALFIMLGMVALGIWASIQFFILPDTRGKRIHGPMLDPNNMAALFNMGMLPAAAAFLGSKDKKIQGLGAFCAIVLFCALVVTQSRAGLVIACFCLLVIAMLLGKRGLYPVWKPFLYVIMPWVIYKIVNYKSDNVLSSTFSELTFIDKSASIVDRRSLWSAGWTMLKTHPLGDIGLGNFYYFYPAFRSPTDMSDGFFVHMDPLQIALETGWPAAILFYGFLISVFIRMIMAYNRLAPQSDAKLVLIASFSGLLSIALHSHINYNLYMPGILIPLGILLAVWFLATEHARDMQRVSLVFVAGSRKTVAIRIMVMAFLAIFALWPAQAGITSYMMMKVAALENTGNHDAAVQMLERARRYGTYNNFSIYEVLAKLELQNATRSPEGSEERAAYIRRGMMYIMTARRYNPVFTLFESSQAQFLYLGHGSIFPDGMDQAEMLLRDVIFHNPLDTDSRQGLALILQGQGRNREALDILEQGLSWPRPKGVPDVQFILSVAKARQLLGDQAGYEQMNGVAVQKAKDYGMSVN